MDEKVKDFIEDVNEVIEDVDELADAAEEVLDAAEEVGKEVGGLLTRILNGLARFINYIKGLFRKD